MCLNLLQTLGRSPTFREKIRRLKLALGFYAINYVISPLVFSTLHLSLPPLINHGSFRMSSPKVHLRLNSKNFEAAIQRSGNRCPAPSLCGLGFWGRVQSSPEASGHGHQRCEGQ